MDSVGNDPVLAQEMLALMGNELKKLRQQLRNQQSALRDSQSRSVSVAHSAEHATLKEENADLKREVADLRLRLESALEGQDVKPHLLKGSPYDDVCLQLSELEQKRELEAYQHAKEIQQLETRSSSMEAAATKLEERLASYKNKYKNVKEDLSRLQEDLEDTRRERDTILKRAEEAESAHKVKSFSPIEFLSKAEQAVPGRKDMNIRPFTKKGSSCQLEISEAMRALFHADGHLTCSVDQAIWPGSHTNHFLMIDRVHRYYPSSDQGSGSWARTVLQSRLNKTSRQHLEMFYLQDHCWHYCGTYEHVGTEVLSFDEVTSLSSRDKRPTNFLLNRTIQQPDLVPPVVTKTVHKMYHDGVLKAYCMGFRRIGFNTALNNLLYPADAPQTAKGKSTAIAVPVEGSTFAAAAKDKRRSGGAEQGNRPQKRRKVNAKADHTHDD